MRVLRGICVSFLLSSVALGVTVAEEELRKAYEHVGFSHNEAVTLVKACNTDLKNLVLGKQLSVDALKELYQQVMLHLSLSKSGCRKMNVLVNECIVALSKQHFKREWNLRDWVRSKLYRFAAQRLTLYNEVAFQQCYRGEGSVDTVFDSDFQGIGYQENVYVPTKSRKLPSIFSQYAGVDASSEEASDSD